MPSVCLVCFVEILGTIHLDDNLTQSNAHFGILDMNELVFDPVYNSAENC